MEKITAHALSKLSFHGDVNENAVAMALEDTDGNSLAVAVNAQTVTAMLPPLLGLAKEWSGENQLDLTKFTGTKNSLPADRIEFAKGRNEKEIAVRIFMGEVELCFIMSVDEVFAKIGGLAKRVKRADTQSSE